MKDRQRSLSLAPDVEILYTRSSDHPVEYAIMLRAWRDGDWRCVCVFDNAHRVEEHHEHVYVGSEKQEPTVTYAPVNEAMEAALTKLRNEWPALVSAWEQSHDS